MASKKYRSDQLEAKSAVYATHGRGPNPFPPDTRKHRLWVKFKQHHDNMEARFDELAEVYGEFRPDRIESR